MKNAAVAICLSLCVLGSAAVSHAALPEDGILAEYKSKDPAYRSADELLREHGSRSFL